MVRVVLCGMGAIGTEILKYAMEKGHEIVGVVDSDPEKTGRSVAELTGLSTGIRVVAALKDVPMQNGGRS